MGPANEEASAEYEAMIVGEESKQIKDPLIGWSAEILQPEDRPIYYNLVSGTAIVAQAGVWALALIIWTACFLAGLIFFSGHVLLNTTGLLLLTQALLLLQPTHTPAQKRHGTALHFIFNIGSLSCLLLGLIVIEINKFSHDGTHLSSLHAKLGLLTYLLLLIQGVVGFTQYYTPMVYGSIDKAKSIWKYHRASGYLTVTMLGLTVAAAMGTKYNERTLHVSSWVVLGLVVMMLSGIFTRVRLFKFGIGKK